MVALFCVVFGVRAQILVGPGGVGPITFTTIADTNGWTTISKLPNSGTSFPDGASLDASSQTNTSPYIAVTATSTPVNGAVTADAANPPATSGTARWNSALGALATRPTGNSATMLMAEFRNNANFCINAINLSFDMASQSPVTVELPGWHVYYSLSGAAGSWQLIPNLSDVVVTGNLSTNNLPLVSNWAPNTSLFLMFADDNGNGSSDPSYTIDNLTMGVTSCELTCVAITNGPANITVPERGGATFSIMATGAPQNIQWFRSDDGGANFTLIPGATASSYAIASTVYPGDNGATFRATVSNTLCQVTSTNATLTVIPDTTAPTVISAIADVNPVDGQPTIVRLTFSEPMDSVLVNEANFLLYQTGTDPEDPFNATILFPFSAVLTDGTNAVISTEARQPLTDYTIRMLDQRDASSGNNPTIPNPLDVPLKVVTTLISLDGADNEWKYFCATNVDLWATSPDWMSPAYDDTAWSAGAAPLGNDGTVTAPQPAIRTTISFSGADPTTANRRSEPAFFRHHFFVPSSTNGLTLQLRHFFEDGGVVYINGREAARIGVTAAAALNFTTRSTQLAEGAGISAPITLPLTNVFPGSNLISIVVVQNGDTSSDVVFTAELTAIVSKFAAGAPVITGQPVSQSVTEGANVNFSVSADGALPLTYHWSKNGNPLPGSVDNASYSISGVVPADAGNYSVIVSNSLGITNSQIATLTVAPDNSNPVFVSAVASTNGTTITLTITDNFGLNLQTATNPANYTVSPADGGANLTVFSAVQTTSSNIVLTTSARAPLTGYTVATTGIKDRSVAQNPLTPSSRQAVIETLLIGYGSAWKYDQSGMDLGTAWQASGYNDSAWPAGAGVLGFEDSAAVLTLFTNIAGGSGTNTVLSLTNSTLAGIDGTNITFYFRTTVDVPFDPNLPGNSLRLRAYIDDGAAIYVNGVEQFRFNLTNTANYTNFATAGSTEGAAGIIASNITGFVQGNNVIAVEVHQNSRTSSDVDWAMELEGLVTTFGPSCPKPSISYNANTGQVTISWTGAATLEETSALLTPSINTVWVPSSRANGVPFTPSGTMKYYRLACP